MLVDREFPIPSTLSDRVVSIEPLTLMDGRWTIGGCQTLNLTDSRFTFQKRSVCPKGQNASKGSFAKRGTLYTLVGEKGDWLDCKILHVYHLKSQITNSTNTPRPSVKTNTSNLSTSRLRPPTKANAQAPNGTKDSSKKRERCPGTDIASEKCAIESKRERQSFPVRRSARCAQSFQVKEKVFAPDKKKSTSVLYEATIIKLKEDVAGCLRYQVQYKGYKKSHNQWLDAEDLMKETRHNRILFEKSRM